MGYWLIKSLLIIGMIIVIFFVLRPVKTMNSLALRRIGMLIVLLAAVFAVIFPDVVNRFAHFIGVSTGINLLVYLLVIALFAQMASAYRRDSVAEQKLTELARQVALQNATQGQPQHSNPSDKEKNAEASGKPEEVDNKNSSDITPQPNLDQASRQDKVPE